MINSTRILTKEQRKGIREWAVHAPAPALLDHADAMEELLHESLAQASAQIVTLKDRIKELEQELADLRTAISPSRTGMVEPAYYIAVVNKMREREKPILLDLFEGPFE